MKSYGYGKITGHRHTYDNAGIARNAGTFPNY